MNRRVNPWRGLAGLPRAVWVLSAATLVNRSGTMFVPFLVLYLTRARGYTPAAAGAVHWPHRRMLVLGSLLVAAGFGALAFARSLPAVIATVVVWTFCEMLLLPGMASYVADVAPAGSRGGRPHDGSVDAPRGPRERDPAPLGRTG